MDDGGPELVLHLDIQPGTDIALFNGLFACVVQQGWIDKDSIAKHTTGFDEAVKGRLNVVQIDLYPVMFADAAHMQRPAAHRVR
jgi:anaerobic selenocysteine-containing dehydrogenase